MDYDTFVTRVQERCGLEREEAETAIRATLTTLAERLERQMRDHLASQLPTPLKAPLHERQYDYPFLLDEFYNRVAARSGVRHAHAVERAQAVAITLQEATAPGEWAHLTAEMPPEYAELFPGARGGISRAMP